MSETKTYVLISSRITPLSILDKICSDFPKHGEYTKQDINDLYKALGLTEENVNKSTHLKPVNVGEPHQGKVNAIGWLDKDKLIIASTYLELDEVKSLIRNIVSDDDLQKYEFQIEGDGHIVEPQFIFEISTSDIKAGSRLLTEATITVNNEQWVFHKSDADPFPWPETKLHGHYQQKKLNPFTGEIYNVNTKKTIGYLKSKKLMQLKTELKSRKDFKHYFDS